ncbi:MAG TPA: hypothetical protein VFN78_12945, partial [Ktedonobacterales bacterium]|nr:hypothetical protein [Ktedonobacterales bacterium]
MRVPRLSVPLLTRPNRGHRHPSPDVSDYRHSLGSMAKARKLRRQRRLTRHLQQLTPLVMMRQTVRDMAQALPLWRIGRAPVAPGSSVAPAADVVLELPSGASSTRHAIPKPGAAALPELSDDMPAPALR